MPTNSRIPEPEMAGDYPILTSAAACGREEHCIGVCESDAIRMAWVPLEGDTRRGKWCSDASHRSLEVNV
jgi:hypothetical protein